MPPYSVGQLAQIHPPANSLAVHSSLKALRSSGVMEKPGVPQPSGRFSVSQAGDHAAELLGFGWVGQVHGRHGTRPRPAAATWSDGGHGLRAR